MAAIQNDRDLALRSRGENNRIMAPSVLIETTSTPAGATFFTQVPNTGTATPSQIVLTAVLGTVGNYNSPVYKWEYSTSIDPFTWIDLSTNTAALTLTNTTFLTHVGTGVSVNYRVTVSQFGWPTTQSIQVIDYSRLANVVPVVTFLRDSTIVLPVSTAGVVTYANSGNSIRVSINNIYIPYDTAGTNAPNTFTVTVTGSTTPNTVTIGAASTSTTTVTNDTRNFADISGVAPTANPASITYTITIRDYAGVVTTVTKTQTVIAALNGINGNSVFVATVYQQSATLPATPSATTSTYNFATNTLVPPAGWSVQQPATTTTPTYACNYTFSGPAGSTVTGTGSWSAPYIEAVNGSSPLIYSINTSAPVIVKDSPNAATAGTHTSVTIQGKKYDGSTTTNYGWVTITANGGTEATTATNTAITAVVLSPATGDGKTSYTINLYNQSTVAGATLLDSETLNVVFKGATGASAIAVDLSNDSHTFPASVSGAVNSYTGSGTDINVYEGATTLTYDGVGTSNGTWTVTSSATNITRGAISDSGTYATVAQHSGVADNIDTASITYTVTGKTVAGVSFTIPKTQTFSKSKSGSNGEYRDLIQLYLTSATPPTAPTSVLYTFTGNVLGTITGGTAGWDLIQPSATTTPTYVTKALASTTTPGTAITLTGWSTPVIVSQTGLNAKTLRVSADKDIFVADSDNNIAASAIKITAIKQNTVNTVTWSTSPVVPLYTAATGGITTTIGDIVYLRSTDFGTNTDVIITVTIATDSLSDTTSILRVRDGSAAVTAILSNPFVPLPTSAAGVVSYTDSGTTIRVYEGSNLRTITAVNPVASSIAVGSISGLNSTTVTYGDASNIVLDNARITYNITFTKGDGTSGTASITQTFAKNKVGATGTSGNSVFVATVYQQSATLPATPSATTSTYNFATNTLVPPAGWSVQQPATTTTPTYACNYTFSGPAGSTVTGTGSWSAPYIEAVNGSNGNNGEYRDVIELYLASATAPTAPTSVLYTFTGNVLGTITGGTAGWSMTQPDTSTIPTYLTKALASTTTPGTAVTLTGWSTPIIVAQNGATGATGAPGVSGNKNITISAFKWDTTTPTYTGTAIFTWSTNTYSAAPATGWQTSAGAAPGTGYTLYQLNLIVTDVATATTTNINWANAIRNTIGYRQDGTIGQTGDSARTAYIVTTSSTVPGAVTPGTGDVAPTNVVANQVTGWSFSATSTLSAGQYMYQVDGRYINGANITWGNPYLSNLKVGSLSAISADLGVVSISSTGSLSSTGKTYGSATAGVFLGYSGADYKFDVGNSSSYLRWSGAALQTTGLTIYDGTGNILLQAGSNLTNSSLNIPGTVNNVPAGWQNSNITINSNGSLSGAGTGSVTISGIGGLTKSAQNVLSGGGAITVGTLALDNTGARTSGSGVGIAAGGFAAYDSAGKATFSLVAASGAAYFSGEINVGDFTGYAWPPAGKTGAHLSKDGLLIGNWNPATPTTPRQYFQVYPSGKVATPGLLIDNGVLTISEINVIKTLNINGNAATICSGLTSPGGVTTVVVSLAYAADVFIVGQAAHATALYINLEYRASGAATWNSAGQGSELAQGLPCVTAKLNLTAGTWDFRVNSGGVRSGIVVFVSIR